MVLFKEFSQPGLKMSPIVIAGQTDFIRNAHLVYLTESFAGVGEEPAAASAGAWPQPRARGFFTHVFKLYKLE